MSASQSNTASSFGIVVVEGGLQVLEHAEVVDYDATLFALVGSVGPGDGLQQGVVAKRFVEVHHLLDRSIESGQEHIAHDEEFGVSPGREI